MKFLGFFFSYICKVNQKFPKSEKLKSSKTIESLFSDGNTFSKYPLKVFFLEKSDPLGDKNIFWKNQAAFAVPKKKIKLAVNRNRIKRQLRETYRRNKHIIEANSNRKFYMLFLYLGKAKPQYAELDKAMENLLKKLDEWEDGDKNQFR